MVDKFLSVKNLNVSYGPLKVLFDISLEINQGEVAVLVGRNGAGKTTLFRTIAGFLKQSSGEIVYKGKGLAGEPAYNIALQGIKYIHQDKQVFSDLTVKENLELGSYATRDYNWDNIFKYFPKLKELLTRKGGNLSGGERQMLLMAMALLGNPELVLMDEPTEGLAPNIVTDLIVTFKKLCKQTTLFIIEQNLPLIAEIADRVYSMKEGRIVAETVDKIEIKELVFEKYL